MYDVADAFDQLPAGSRLVRVVELRGFGSRHAGEAIAIDPEGGVVAGHLLAGLIEGSLNAAPTTASTWSVDVSDPDAAAAGMACGGRVELFVQPVASVPALAWDCLRDRQPVVVATDLDSGATSAITDDRVERPSIGSSVEAVARDLLRSGRSALETVERTMVESFLPPSTVRIVGRAAVGDALTAQAALLGWEHQVVDGADDAAAAAAAQASHDALVVLSHDPEVDTPALATALRHGRGYVGALGSRGTQAERRDRLAAMGLSPEQIAAIHGPVGLDLGSRTPAETAVAIVAEIIAHRAGRDAASLAAGSGPING